MLGFALLLLAAAYALVRDVTVRMAFPVEQNTTEACVTTAGAATGLLTGFFGVGGGFVIVPALALVLGLPMTLAVGTSLLADRVDQLKRRSPPISQPEPSTSRSPLRSRSPQSPAPPERGCTGRSLNRYCAGSSHCCSSASQHSSSQRTPAAEPASTHARPNAGKQRKNRQVRVLCIPRPSRRRQQRQRAIPHTSRGRPPEAPAGVRQSPQAKRRKPCSSGKSPLIPARPGTTKTGLSRRRSRVRSPSLP